MQRNARKQAFHALSFPSLVQMNDSVEAVFLLPCTVRYSLIANLTPDGRLRPQILVGKEVSNRGMGSLDRVVSINVQQAATQARQSGILAKAMRQNNSATSSTGIFDGPTSEFITVNSSLLRYIN